MIYGQCNSFYSLSYYCSYQEIGVSWVYGRGVLYYSFGFVDAGYWYRDFGA